jgi:hypothetical protein
MGRFSAPHQAHAELTDYLRAIGINVRDFPSEIDAIERVEILRFVRQGELEVLAGINLLPERPRLLQELADNLAGRGDDRKGEFNALVGSNLCARTSFSAQSGSVPGPGGPVARDEGRRCHAGRPAAF